MEAVFPDSQQDGDLTHTKGPIPQGQPRRNKTGNYGN